MNNFVDNILLLIRGILTDKLDVTLSSRTKPSDNQNIQFGDTHSVDAFGRARVSEPFGVFDSKQISSNTATDTYQYDRSSTYLTIGTASGDRAVRQTARYFPYVPGKSHSIIMTGIFGAGKVNVNQYIGY